MAKRAITLLATAAACAAVVLVAGAAITAVTLPSGFRLSPPQMVATVGTMPQGLALSPDGNKLAVVESGVNPAALRILNPADLSTIALIPLPGAFGKPVWQDNATVLVAGGNTDSVLVVDVPAAKIARQVPIGKGTWPCAIALPPEDSTLQGTLAVANDGDGSVSLVDLTSGTVTKHLLVGAHPSDVAVARDGATYVAVRSISKVAVLRDGAIATWIAVGKHPAALGLDEPRSRLYVANSDDDTVSTIGTTRNTVLATADVRLRGARAHGYGSLPNGLTVVNGIVYVSLGGANAVAVIPPGRSGTVAGMAPAGWYPTGVATTGNGIIFVSNGKGERAPPNALYNPFTRSHREQYVAAQTVGSVRRLDLNSISSQQARVLVGGNAAMLWRGPAQSVLRAHGPIAHVIYIIKENRSYDQILGDIAGANGDPSLVWFGRSITPNQHAIAERFGVFDNAYANAQISADGHNWTDAAIANDYVERFWPQTYGDRRDLYDFQDGNAPDVPHSGYLWDAAHRAGITYRDYGENIVAPNKGGPLYTTFANLKGHFDPRFAGWNLNVSDADRYAEWSREFHGFERGGNLPALEIVYFPNDHTGATAPGLWTPQAYVATNDLVVGKLVDSVSRSRYWKSTAIFMLEDDAQNGPDHVSDQRSTFYVASPYAKGGFHHDHYSTASVLHSIELILGLQPLSLYDVTAEPFYAAFGMAPDLRPFTALQPNVDMNARNLKTAYGAGTSARMNWRVPDAVDAATVNDILAHVAGRH